MFLLRRVCSFVVIMDLKCIIGTFFIGLLISFSFVCCEWITFESYFEKFNQTEINSANIIKAPCAADKKQDPLGKCRRVYWKVDALVTVFICGKYLFIFFIIYYALSICREQLRFVHVLDCMFTGDVMNLIHVVRVIAFCFSIFILATVDCYEKRGVKTYEDYYKSLSNKSEIAKANIITVPCGSNYVLIRKRCRLLFRPVSHFSYFIFNSLFL